MVANRILHVVEAFSTGILQSISQICNSLNDDFEFSILHGNRKETPQNLQSYFSSEIRLIPWCAKREIDASHEIRTLCELRNAVTEIKPDIIHAHSSKAGALSRLFALHCHLPVIYSPRGYSFLRRDISLPVRTGYRLLEWGLGRLPHITVACGIGELLQAARVSPHVQMIPNMIDTRNIDLLRCTPRMNGERLTVAMSGGIRPQKNFTLFAEIANILRNDEFDFLWIGGGEIPVQQPLPANLKVTGWLDRNDAVKLLAQADVFAQTSLWEGLPIALLEAMALGLPVLSTPGVGNSELVLDGVNGYICEDARDFERRLRALAAVPEDRVRMGQSSRNIVDRNHAVLVNAPRWASLYQAYSRYEKFTLLR